MAYAEMEDLLEWLGVDEAALDARATAWLDRASRVIDEVMFNQYDATNDDHVTAATQAVCAQIEFWLLVGIEDDVMGTRGGGQVMGYRAPRLPVLAPDARRILRNAGLLYTGLSLS